MRTTIVALAALVALGAASPQAARSWDATGHMAVADIAYQKLTPKTRAAVNLLLRHHKAYATWLAEKPAGYGDTGRYIFERAATWPDEIRGTADSRPIWHYIDIPVAAPGYALSEADKLIVKPNAVTQIVAESGVLHSAKASDSDRATALSWVEHLVGDIHQPLHAASYFSAQFPKGDRGGNSIRLKSADLAGDPIEMAAHPKNLHALWDVILGTSRDPAQIDSLAAQLEAPQFARSQFPQIAQHKTAEAWAVESNTLARNVAYADGRLPMKPDGAKAQATLPAGYIANARRVADRQIAVAGLRLADLLNSTKFPTAAK